MKMQRGNYYVLKSESEIYHLLENEFAHYNDRAYRNFISPLIGQVLKCTAIHPNNDRINVGFIYLIPIVFIDKECTKEEYPEYFL